MEARLVDTNVMLAANAIHRDLQGLEDNGASPPESELRELAYVALKEFEESERFIVLDTENTIREEYERNMSYSHPQEYGLLTLQSKLDKNQFNIVTIDVIEQNGERIAVLNDALEELVYDREDRKWIAAGLAHQVLHGTSSPIMYAAEFDWFQLEEPLAPHGIEFIRLLPKKWYESKLARDA
jgi:hypothetical protein